MNNKDVCDYLRKLNDKCVYIADQCVDERYGQTCGGYLSSKSNDPKSIKQKEHFLDYYGERERLTYQYLRCPQLLLFIAEISGLSDKKLNTAYDLLKEYENSNGLYNTDKSGNYLIDMRRKNKLNNRILLLRFL